MNDKSLYDSATLRDDATPDLQRRLASYTVTALALSGALTVGQQSAQAAIVFFNPTSPTTAFVNGNPLLFDFGTGLTNYTSSNPSPGPGQFALYAQTHFGTLKNGYVRGSFSGNEKIAVDPGTEVPYAHKFAVGEPVAAAHFSTGLALLFLSSHSDGRTHAVGEFPQGSNHDLMGFSFELPSTGSSQYFGWADVSVDAIGDITLNGFAYNNTPGGPIPAGIGSPVVPEVSPLLLLLAGGPAAMAAYRQMRKRNEPNSESAA